MRLTDCHSLPISTRVKPKYSAHGRHSKVWRLCLEQSGIHCIHDLKFCTIQRRVCVCGENRHLCLIIFLSLSLNSCAKSDLVCTTFCHTKKHNYTVSLMHLSSDECKTTEGKPALHSIKILLMLSVTQSTRVRFCSWLCGVSKLGEVQPRQRVRILGLGSPWRPPWQPMAGQRVLLLKLSCGAGRGEGAEQFSGRAVWDKLWSVSTVEH